MQTQTTNRLLNGLVIAGIVLTLLALAVTPLILTAFFKSSAFATDSPLVVPLVSGCLYACAVPYLAALFQLKIICKCLSRDSGFSPRIPKKFRAIAVCALAEAVIFLAVQAVLYFGFDVYLYALTVLPSLVVTFVCAVAALLALAMANVFQKGLEIKEENDSIF